MESGIDFVRSQVNNAVMQHQAFLDSLVDHEAQADDQRFRDLCSRHIPKMREHQRMLEEYQLQLGRSNRNSDNPLEMAAGTAKKMFGQVLGKAKDLADAAREGGLNF